MADEPKRIWTVLDLIGWTAGFFARKGIDSARLDAELLLAKVLGMDRMGLYISYDRPLDPAELAAFRELVQERSRRVPVKYLLGECEFMSLRFEVGPGVLVPRPETEHLVERAVERIKEAPAGPPLVYDVCTGSGCIAVAVAKACESACVAASDLSNAALQVAKRNVVHHGLAGRITLVAGDLLAAFPSDVRADLILSNPPYVSEAEWATLQPEIVEHEPREALVAGTDGLDCLRRLITDAPPRLKPGGALLCEIGHDQATAVASLVEAVGVYAPPIFYKDLAGIDRVLEASLV